MLTFLSAPMVTVTALGRTSPGTKFRLEAVGRGVPDGKMVSRLCAVASVTVTFRTTDRAVGETPLKPPTFRSMVWPGPTLVPALNGDRSVRVSRIRVGAIGKN